MANTTIPLSTHHNCPQKERGALTKWLQLTLGACLIVFFIFGVAPFFERYEMVGAYTEYVTARDIDAGELWWADVEIVADAEIGARTTFEFTPRLND